MGSIDISDGISRRRIRIAELTGDIRIELQSDGRPRVIVPEAVDVEMLQPAT